MRLYSVQTEEVLQQALKGEYFTDPTKSELLTDDKDIGFDKMFRDAYDWMVEQMEEKGITKPKEATYPIWAWYRHNGKRRPDLRLSEFRTYPKGTVLLELVVPDNEVLLSDEESFHAVINKWSMDDSIDSDSVDPTRDVEDEIKNTWYKVFNLEEDDFGSGDFIQATFWSIKPEYIKGYQRFGRGSLW